MTNANDLLYAAGNPRVPYAAIPAESAYEELDREHSRRLGELALLRGERNELRADLKDANRRAFWATVALGLYTVGALVVVGILLFR
jgi:hypothetical protein